jgi:uncharacterized membrane protein
MAIPIASGLGLLASNAWIAHRLGKSGFACPLGLLDFARVFASVIASAALGYATASMVGWPSGFVVTCLAYLALLLVTGALRREDWMMLCHLRRQPISEEQNKILSGG